MHTFIDFNALMVRIRGSERPEIDDGAQEVDWIEKCLSEAPKLSPDDVRGVGEWERIDYTVGHDYKCLACGKLNDRASNYCPDCGKRMRMKGAEDG